MKTKEFLLDAMCAQVLGSSNHEHKDEDRWICYKMYTVMNTNSTLSCYCNHKALE